VVPVPRPRTGCTGRGGRCREERLTDLPPETSAPSDVEHEERILIRRALAAAPPKQRAVIVLRYR